MKILEFSYFCQVALPVSEDLVRRQVVQRDRLGARVLRRRLVVLAGRGRVAGGLMDLRGGQASSFYETKRGALHARTELFHSIYCHLKVIFTLYLVINSAR